MLFFRQLLHLLPRGIAWRMTVDKPLRRFLQGMSQSSQAARDFVDAVWLDLLPDTTRELDRWEETLGLTAAPTDSARRLAYAAAWAAQGGQSPRYLQDVIQAAGFPLYVHEWWYPVPVYRAQGVLLVVHTGDVPPFSGGEEVWIGTGVAQRGPYRVESIETVGIGDAQQNLTVVATGTSVDASWAFPAGEVEIDVPAGLPAAYQLPVYVSGSGITVEELGAPYARDPHPYIEQPRIGTVQAGDTFSHATAPNATAPDPLPGPLFDLYPQANRFLRNDTHYLVNLTLTPEAPPPVPDDPGAWPYFLYFGGETFGDVVDIPAARRDELERLLLKLRPSQQWIVTLVNYV